MIRFRKKSDPKRVHIPEDVVPRPFPPHHHNQQPHHPLPALPPVDDFRTSLILPGLTRRFSVLRNSSGEPIGLDDLKSKFAEQRARGSEHQVTEEEEDMILEALGKFHAKSARVRGQPSTSTDDVGTLSGDLSTSVATEDHEAETRASASPSFSGRQSVRSTTTTASSIGHSAMSTASLSPTKGSLASRRMSNNLFGSGKFRDHSYLRTVNQRRTDSTRSSTITHSDSTTSMNTITSSKAGLNPSTYSDGHSLRPVTPEGSGYSNSVPSSPGYDKAADSASETSDTTAFSTRLTGTLLPENLGRASKALDEVIRELEEEGDDEIVMERSPITRVPSTKPVLELEPEATMSPPAEYEAGQAVSSDVPVVADESHRESPGSRSRQASPVPRLPGYIPGMPRPMTPHEPSVDTDDQTPSATPRATSPRLPSIPSHSPMLSQTLAMGLLRSNSSASTTRPGPRSNSPASTPTASSSPYFFNRSTNGRYTPEDRARNLSSTPDPDPESPTLGRRRPTSPLSGPAYQPLASTNSNSRPSTPSNITWNTSAGTRPGRSGSFSGHSRNNSTASIGVTSTEALAGHADGLDRSKSLTRSLRSPALPDSPFIDNGHTGISSVMNQGYRPPSAMSGIDLGSPAQSAQRPLRSPTPTHNGTSSPTGQHFPSFVNGTNGFTPSPRVSRQNNHNSFTMSPAHALLLQPLVNSSRSSLESAGSSYHSWDEDHKKDRLFGFFANLDPQQPEWHDITISVHNKSGSSTSGTGSSPSYGGTTGSEEIVRREIGLSKNDFVAIQDKLVTAALTKAATPESRHRAASIRRRRPSTSQSNYSVGGGDSRIGSPVSQPSSPATPPRVATSDQLAKASALLDSVVDSIQSPRSQPQVIQPLPEPTVSTPATEDTQPTQPSPSARHRALADALFGVQDEPKTPTESPSPPTPPIVAAPVPVQSSHIVISTAALAREETPVGRDQDTPKPSSSKRDLTTPVPPHRAPSTPPGPQVSGTAHGPTPNHADAILLEVKEKVERATAALGKSPTHPKFSETGSTRKRIDPTLISSPTLVSASTSVDAIPLRPAVHAVQKESRWKRLIPRAKPHAHAGEEITPFPMDLRSQQPSHSPSFSPYNTMSSSAGISVSSVTDSARSRPSTATAQTPPAPSSPGIKGLMSSIFRKHRTADVSPPHSRAGPTNPAALSATLPPPVEKSLPPFHPQIHSAPPTKSQFSTGPPSTPSTPRPNTAQALFTPEPTIPENSVASAALAPAPGTAQTPSIPQEDEALRQLFDAASNLGLDQSAIGALLARSPSTARSTAAWSRLARENSVTGNRKSVRSVARASTISEYTQYTTQSEGRPSVDSIPPPVPQPSIEVKQLNIRKNTEPLTPRPRPNRSEDASNPIVRRTIVFANDSRTSGFDLGALIRKQSTSRKRRSAGAGSFQSNRSIQDRAPTPPPPPKVGGRRFSVDTASPPVPQLPGSLAVPSDHLHPGQMEKSNSAYDSLYDMYAGESRAGSSTNPDLLGAQHAFSEPMSESAQAVEVVELANGEIIWSIVNGLRDDDAESAYGDRASFTSEYSQNEAVKVFFKEHGRKSSKSSAASFLSRKKNARPETKVLYSSSAKIGRLIENLSQGVDSGSFNITPDRSHSRVGHSASSSYGSSVDMHLTVEERLTAMLDSIASP